MAKNIYNQEKSKKVLENKEKIQRDAIQRNMEKEKRFKKKVDLYEKE